MRLLLFSAIVTSLVACRSSSPGADPDASTPPPDGTTDTGNDGGSISGPRYLSFQVFTFPGSFVEAGGQTLNSIGTPLTDKPMLENAVNAVFQEVGSLGDSKTTQLAFASGPFSFDMTDDQTRTVIDNAFAVGMDTNVAVVLHIDDQMFWLSRTDLSSNPANIEWSDWSGTVNTGRYINWGQEVKLAPQMCLNSPDIKNLVTARATLIGSEIQKNVNTLASSGKEYLFGGVIVGWEAQIGHDFETRKPLGFCALTNRGFSATSPPADMDLERQHIVTEFIKLWADSLVLAGVSRNKIYSHFAFVSEDKWDSLPTSGLFPNGQGNSYSEWLGFSPPAVVSSTAFNPGFSTYPQGGTFLQQMYDELTQQETPPWASSEGAPVGVGAETYLAQMFNHGATLVNIFADPAVATSAGGGNSNPDGSPDSADTIAAYQKFLSGGTLVQSLLAVP